MGNSKSQVIVCKKKCPIYHGDGCNYREKIVLKQIHKEAATTDFGDKQIAPILRLGLRIFSKTDEFPFGCVAF